MQSFHTNTTVCCLLYTMLVLNRFYCTILFLYLHSIVRQNTRIVEVKKVANFFALLKICKTVCVSQTKINIKGITDHIMFFKIFEPALQLLAVFTAKMHGVCGPMVLRSKSILDQNCLWKNIPRLEYH